MTPNELLEQCYIAKCNTRGDIHEHMPTLRKYATGCDHVTEMGVRYAVSTYAFLAAMPKRFVCYDIVPAQAITDALELGSKNGIDCTFHLEDTTKAVIEPTDLLFIDTLHVYAQLSAELTLHAGKVSKWIILHDTWTFGLRGSDGGEGLWKAVTELEGWKVREKFDNNHGLTVLERC